MIKNQYPGVFNIFSRYWRFYGGSKSVLGSPYAHLAGIITAISYHRWWYEKWWEDPIAILPNVLGFTLGGYAVLLAIGDERFRNAISGSQSSTPSPFMSANSIFVHFTTIQVAALLWAICFKSVMSVRLNIDHFPYEIVNFLIKMESFISILFSAIGFFLFIYSLTCALAAVMAVFRVALWYDKLPKDDA